MTGIIWEDPPEQGRNTSGRWTDLTPLMAELRTRPNTWGRLPVTYSTHVIPKPQRDHYHDFQWSARRRPDGRYDHYARWIGDT